ncbi:hypothetical protein IT774_07995 [Salinimonas marina]|uniref:Uncharacterized protein n=1 Tax=Salinimonas marina TaxID=2785918 RepID=A0A7S9DZY4_9ALTE|nr:hypothetical protein [Salinimonas marina]QPG07033.1 hypothetical protein IT774_07995 [Salinimonas marina]
MTNEIHEQHAKTLIGVIEQSALWKLHPEKRSPFASAQEAIKYVESHNEPLCIRVPVAGSDDHLTVKVTSSGEDVVFTNVSFEDAIEERIHSSHLKLVESTVSNMLNSRLPEGKKVASF